MLSQKRLAIGLLRLEIENVRKRGLGAVRSSVLCLARGREASVEPCSDCPLLEFVAPELRNQTLPCLHIPLNDAGCTLASASRPSDPKVCEQLVLTWMERATERLERELAEEQQGRL